MTHFLPEGVADLLPQQALKLEQLRNTLLQIFATWGYRFVKPALIEYVDATSQGLAAVDELHNQTFRTTDHRNGKMLGIRADYTPQIARIDQHCCELYGRASLQRFAYFGNIVRLKPQQLVGGGIETRYQAGFELFGADSTASDAEVLSLLIAAMRKVVGKRRMIVVIGHTTVVASVVENLGFSTQQIQQFKRFLLRKNSHDLCAWLALLPQQITATQRQILLGLAQMLTPYARLDALQQQYAENAVITQTIATLQDILGQVDTSAVDIMVDFGDVRGFSYHRGIVFSMYVDGCDHQVARGGRYQISSGETTRSAVGASLHIDHMVAINDVVQQNAEIIWVPFSLRLQAQQWISQQRTQGKQVICGLQNDAQPPSEITSILHIRDSDFFLAATEHV